MHYVPITVVGHEELHECFVLVQVDWRRGRLRDVVMPRLLHLVLHARRVLLTARPVLTSLSLGAETEHS